MRELEAVEAVTVFLGVILGAVVVVSLVGLLLSVARRRRGGRVPKVVSVDEQVGELWARQVAAQRPFVRAGRNAA